MPYTYRAIEHSTEAGGQIALKQFCRPNRSLVR